VVMTVTVTAWTVTVVIRRGGGRRDRYYRNDWHSPPSG